MEHDERAAGPTQDSEWTWRPTFKCGPTRAATWRVLMVPLAGPVLRPWLAFDADTPGGSGDYWTFTLRTGEGVEVARMDTRAGALAAHAIADMTVTPGVEVERGTTLELVGVPTGAPADAPDVSAVVSLTIPRMP